MVNVGTAMAYLDMDTSGFSRGFKSAKSDLKVFNDSMASAGDKTQAFGNTLTSVGKGLSLGLSVPLIALGGIAIKTAADFEAAMSEVKALTGATGTEFEALTGLAREMGATTKFTAQESAQAMNYMAQAGWTTQQMLDGLPGVMTLAAAAGADLATTSNIVTDSLAAFGLTAADTAHFADVLAVAANATNTDVVMLGESFKYVAPVAGTFGYAIEDVSVLLGLMANNGIKAGQAGTSLRQIFLGLQGGVTLTGAALGEYDFNVANADGSMRDLGEVTLELREAFSQMTAEEQAMNAEMIGGARSIGALLSIVNTSDEAFNSLTGQLNNANGAAQSMADTMMDNLNGQITILKSGLEGLAISFGNVMLPAIKAVIQVVQDITDWLNNLNEGQKQTVVIIGTVLAALGPVLIIGGKVVTTVGKMQNAWKSLTTTLATQKAALLADTAATTANEMAKSKNFLTAAKGQVTLKALGVVKAAEAKATAAATIADQANMAAKHGGMLAQIKATAASIAASVAQGGYTLATGIATVATNIFNAALNAIPFIAIATAIIAVVAGLVALVSWLFKGSEANEEYKNKIEAVNEAQEQMASSLQEADSAFSSSLSGIQAAAAQSRNYVDEIGRLEEAMSGMTEEQRKSSTEYYKMQAYIEQLNAAQEGLNLTYNAATGELSSTVDEMERYIAASEEQAKIAAMSERTAEANQALIDIEKELIDIALLRQDIETDAALSESERTKRLNDLAETEQGYLDMRTEATGTLTSLLDMQAEAEQAAAAASTERIDAEAIKMAELVATYNMTEEQIRASMEAQQLDMEEWQVAQDEILQRAQEAYDGYFETVTSGFETMKQKSTISLEEFMENMRANQEATANWSNNMNTLMAAGVDAGVIAQLEKLGPAGAEQAQRFVEELTALNDGADISLGELNAETAARLAELEEVFGSGAELSTQLVQDEFAREDFIASGGQAIEAMAIEVGNSSAVLEEEMRVTIRDAKTAAVNQVTASNFNSVGTQMNQGIVNGINSSKGSVISAMSNVITEAVAAAKAAAGIASPSKVARKLLGIPLPQGVALGIMDGIKYVVAAAQEMMNATFDAAESTSRPVGLKLVGAGAGGGTIVQDDIRGSGQNDPDEPGEGSKTYNFYGTPPLDEVETARQMRKAEEQIAAGLL